MALRFEALDPYGPRQSGLLPPGGFDASVPSQPWLMVPENGVNGVRLREDAGASFRSSNRRAVVDRIERQGSDTLVYFEGCETGSCIFTATSPDKRQPALTLEVAVKRHREYRVQFTRVIFQRRIGNTLSDIAEASTGRDEMDASMAISGLNEIFLPQANVSFTNGDFSSLPLPAKTTSNVLTAGGQKDDVVEMFDQMPVRLRPVEGTLSVFFAREVQVLRQREQYDVDALTPVIEGWSWSSRCVLIEDFLGGLPGGPGIPPRRDAIFPKTLAHEVLHVLRNDSPGSDIKDARKRELLHFYTTDGGVRLSKDDINRINP